MLEVRITDEPADVVQVLATLAEHVRELPGGPGLEESLARIMRDPSYRFVVAYDEPYGLPAAAGVVTFFLQPMIDEHLLAVEVLWFRDHDLTLQLPVWRMLTKLARQIDFGGVCIPVRCTNAKQALHELVEHGVLDGDPVTLSRVPLQKQGNPSSLRSALSRDPITDRAFVSEPSVLVHTRKTAVELSGRKYEGSAPLYRGEGRLVCRPHWDCADLAELAAVHFAKGLYARPRVLPVGSTAPFSGTIAEQLLHQGYVGQGAVSLSTSFEVAANYANHAGQRKDGLVFTLDTEHLRHYTEIFDATATLAAACPWIPREAWAPLRRVVRALRTDLSAAGHFLDRSYKEAFERAWVGAGSLAPPPDPFSYLSAEGRAAMADAGVSGEELARVHDVFEEFAEFALQRIGAVEELHVDDKSEYTVESQRVGPMAYFEVFARIVNDLRAACPDGELGWDTTPMGYIAKTVRDNECFAAGPVPGEFIVEAHVVNSAGHPCRRITAA